MAEVDIPDDDSDLYCCSSGSEDSIASVDRTNHGPLLSSLTDNLSKDEVGSTSGSVYSEQRSDGLGSDSDLFPASDLCSDEEEEEDISSPGVYTKGISLSIDL